MYYLEMYFQNQEKVSNGFANLNAQKKLQFMNFIPDSNDAV